MKKLLFISLFVWAALLVQAQAPELFNYQAVIRDAQGQTVNNQNVSLRLSIHQGLSVGPTVYQEEHLATTNDFGLVNLHIGNGTNKVGKLGDVAWGSNVHVLNISVDLNGGTDYKVMGYSQLVSVPYALYAANVSYKDTSSTNELQMLSLSNDTLYLSNGNSVYLPVKDYSKELKDINDSLVILNSKLISLEQQVRNDSIALANHLAMDQDLDSTNEVQSLSISGNTLSISKGNSIVLPSGTASLDNDTTNELITTVSFIGTTLSITDAGGTKSVNLGLLLDNTDSQNLSLSGNTLSISGGNSVTLPSGSGPNNDNDSTNELNASVSFTGTTLTITDAGGAKSANLAALLDNTDSQTLSLTGNVLSISGGNNVTLPASTINLDNDSTNEIQTQSLSGTDLTLTKGGGTVSLASFLDNTDGQTLTIAGNTLTISGGNSVTLPAGGGPNNDNDSTNEIQSISLNANNLILSNGGGTVSLASYLDNTDAQAISFNGDTLYLSNGGWVYLGGYTNTDAQSLSLAGNVLTISGGNSVTLPSSTINLDNDSTNEIQSLSISGNTLTITKGNSVTLPSGLPNLDNDSTNELQSLSLNTDTLFISQGNFVVLPTGTVNTDDQNLSLSGDTLYIEDGTPVVLSQYINTDSQSLSVAGSTLSISGGNSVTLPAGGTSNDNDSTNEIQQLSLNSDTIFISKGNYIVLPSGTVNTDDQNLTISGDTLYIEDGNSVLLSTYLDNTDSQTLSLSGNTLSISGGNSVTLASGTVNNDNDSTNELQNLSLNSDTLAISNGNFVVLPSGTVNTDDQNLTLSNDTLRIEDGNFVILPAATPNNDNDSTNELQAISISNDTIFLSDGGFVKLPASSTSDTLPLIIDADRNTSVNVSSTNDNIDFVQRDTTFFRMNRHTLEAVNSGRGVFIGESAGSKVKNSTNNSVFIGHEAGMNSNLGLSSVAVGSGALRNSTGGVQNTAIGSYALQNTDSGNFNTALGMGALFSNTSGSGNVAIGFRTLYNNPNGTGNIVIGNQAAFNETGSNKLYIENSFSTQPLIYGEFDNDSLRFNSAVEVRDELYLPNGAAAGRVLTSDASGKATWQNVPAASPNLDNDSTNELQSLTLAGNSLSISNGNTVTLPSAPANNDNDSTNEFQNLSIAGNTISISNGNSITLPASAVNNDNDSTNEYNTALSLSGNTLSVTDGGGAKTADLSSLNQSGEAAAVDAKRAADSSQFASSINMLNANAYKDSSATNELQNLSVSGNTLSISSGNSVTLPSAPVNNDNDSTNEIQDLQLVGSTLSITKNSSATNINLAPFMGTNTDSQQISIANDTIFLTNGGFAKLPADQVNDADADSTNEIQSLSLSGNNLTLSKDGTVDLSSFKDNTDAQTLSISGSTITITGGNSINLPASAINNDNDSTNEFQTISLSGNNLTLSDGGGSANLSGYLDNTDSQSLSISGNTISISGGNSINLPATAVNNDNDSTNELISSFVLSGNNLSVTDAGGSKSVSLVSYLDNTDSQNLSLSGNTLSISGGNSVTLPAGTTSNDNDSTNEIQTISLSGNTLNLSDGGGSANLSGYLDNTDSQSLSLSGNTLSISGGNSVTLPSGGSNSDTSATNELNTSVSFSGTTLTVTDAGGAKSANLNSLLDNTDSQTLSISGNTISITGGNSINLPAGSVNNDNDSTNEIQTLSLSGNTLNLSDGGGSANLATYLDNTDSQTLSLSGSTLSIAGGNSVTLPSAAANNDNDSTNELNTAFALSGNNLTITDAGGGKTVDMSAFMDNTDAQTLSLSGNTLSISGGNNVTLPSGSTYTTKGIDSVLTAGNNAAGLSLTNLGSLSVNNGVSASTLQMTTGAGVGKILTSDAAGNASWQSPATVSAPDAIKDADDDTKIQVEESSDEDVIRFDVAGTERWAMTATRIEPRNTGGSTFLGAGAGASDDLSTNYNTFIGHVTGTSVTTGYRNVAMGAFALTTATNGYDNIAMGYQAMNTTTSGNRNLAMGYQALYTNTTGFGNVALGYRTLRSSSNRSYNVAIGFDALYNNNGTGNIGVGYYSLRGNVSGNYNSAFGYRALTSNVSGQRNIAIGFYSMLDMLTGGYNVAIGDYALNNNINGNNNVVLGRNAGFNNVTGSSNIFIGYNAGYNETGSNKLYIDNSNTVTPLIHGDFSSDELTVNGDLEVTGGVTIPTSAGVGKVLTSDASGNATWQNPGSVSLGDTTQVSDLDGDTKIQMEESSDEDIIRFDIGGTEHWAMVGARMLALNNGGSVFIGEDAGLNDDLSNNNNNFIGYHAGRTTTTGYNNVAMGFYALRQNSSGHSNAAYGAYSLYLNQTGQRNTASGYASLRSNVTGSYNTASGYYALYGNSTGQFNTAQGYYALAANSTGNYNTGIGSYALRLNTIGYDNVSIGDRSLYSNTSGYRNEAIGRYSAYYNTTGYYNTGLGYASLYRNTTGNNNVGVGYAAGYFNQTGAQNTNIGVGTGPSSLNSFTNTTAIGYDATITANNQVRIGNSAVNSIGGQVGWSTLSDGRFKENVKNNVAGLEFIMALKPVTYTLNTEKIYETLERSDSSVVTEQDVASRAQKSQTIQTGFIAQEVEEAAQSVGFSFSGVDKPKNESDIYGLRYSEFVVPLVKGMQEQQESIQKQQQIIDAQQKLIEDLQKRLDALEQK